MPRAASRAGQRIMDGLTLKAITAAADRLYQGTRISEVRWVRPGGLWLGFGSRLGGMVLSVHPSLYGLFIMSGKGTVRQAMVPAVEVMRRRLKGARIESISMPTLDRVVRISAVKMSCAGRTRRLVLVFEPISRWSNIILTGEPEETVITALKVFPGGGGRRTIMPGRPYEPPPPGRGADPSGMSKDDLAGLLEDLLHTDESAWAEELQRDLLGLSSHTAADIVRAAGRGGSPSPESLSKILLEMISDPPAEAGLSGPEEDRLRLVLHVPGAEPAGVEWLEITKAAGLCYEKAAGALNAAQLLAEAGRTIQKRLKHMEKLVLRLDEDLREASMAEDYRGAGSLIMAHMTEIEKGSVKFETENAFGEKGSKASIYLEPKLSPVENAERYFKLARKMKSRKKYLSGRRKELSESMEKLARQRREIEGTSDPSRLEKLVMEAVGHDRSKTPVEEPRPAPSPGRRPQRYIEYRDKEGFRIIVGRNASSNDYVLNRVASPDDVWCHADGFAGAHVILKGTGRTKEAADSALLKACMLAAYYSKGKDQPRVPVSYTRRRYVRKPKGAPAGMVILRQRHTMIVKPTVPEGTSLVNG